MINIDKKKRADKRCYENIPDECCGFLEMKKGEEREIIEILVVDNAKEGDKKKIRNYS